MAITRTGSTTLDPLIIGKAGAGSLAISGGSDLTGNVAYVGTAAGEGTLNISGKGSVLKLASRANYTDNGMLYAGEGSGLSGAITIADGGALLVSRTAHYSPADAFLGVNGGTGRISIDGQGSRMTLLQQTPAGSLQEGSADLFLGYRGTGELTLSNSAVFLMHGDEAHLNVGRGSESTGNLKVLSGASVTVEADGAKDREAAIEIGGNFGTGDMIIDGPGSTVTVSRTGASYGRYSAAQVGVGLHGKGDASVTNGGTLVIAGAHHAQLSVGMGQGTGSMEVTGNGSTVSLASAEGKVTVVVGEGERGVLTISSGGRLVNESDGVMWIGGGPQDGMSIWPGTVPDGAVVVDGGGNTKTLLDAGRKLILSSEGKSSLKVLGGATVTAGDISTGSRGIVSGDGTLKGTVHVDDGGRLAPESAGSPLTVLVKLFSDGGIFVFDHLSSTAAAVDVSGQITLTEVTGINVRQIDSSDLTAGQDLLLLHSDTALDASATIARLSRRSLRCLGERA